MSKLFKLKEWLTIAETAKHLSVAFSEEVSEADVLRLGLEKKLTLSVNFVNHAYARKGKIVSWLETDWFLTVPPIEIQPKQLQPFPDIRIVELPTKLAELYSDYSKLLLAKPMPFMRSTQLDKDRYLQIEQHVVILSGVWDLMMVGAEALDIEQRYQTLIEGVDVKLNYLDGVFVERNGVVCQLVDGNRNNYHPAAGLPLDCNIVVKISAISDLLNSLSDAKNIIEKPLSTREQLLDPRERNSLLTLIAALLIQAKFEPKKRGTTGALVKCTEILGTPLSDDTVRKILDQINEIEFNNSL